MFDFIYKKNVQQNHSMHLNMFPCNLMAKTLRVRLDGMKTGMMENRERKIEWKMTFSLIWFRRENKRDRK